MERRRLIGMCLHGTDDWSQCRSPKMAAKKARCIFMKPRLVARCRIPLLRLGAVDERTGSLDQRKQPIGSILTFLRTELGLARRDEKPQYVGQVLPEEADRAAGGGCDRLETFRQALSGIVEVPNSCWMVSLSLEAVTS